MQRESPSVVVVGAGAIGAFYGAALARQGARVAVVCRSDVAVVQRTGFHIHSAILGDSDFVPARVYDHVSDVDPYPDYLLLCTKVLPGVDRAALIRPAVGPDTVLVLIQNGIDIEADVQRAFPDHQLISALAFIGVSRTAPGHILHQTLGDLTLGSYPAGSTAAVLRLAACFEAGGIRCTVTDEVVRARWQKAVWNAVFNPISILGGALDTATMVATQHGEALVRRALREVCAVAAAVGHAQAPDLPDRYIAGTRAMPAYKTSMALDFENGRPLELEAILGNTVAAAHRAGVAIPTLETLYGLAKMVEAKARPGGAAAAQSSP